MKIQDLIIPFVLAILTTWAIQYIFFGKKETDQTRFTAPQSALEYEPLNKEIIFSQERRGSAPQLTMLSTTWGMVELSTDGGTISRLEFKRKMNGYERALSTIYPSEIGSKENRAFLVGFNAETPFFYQLVDQQELPDKHIVTYQAVSDTATIRKSFEIYKNVHQLDLILTLMPKSDKQIQARVFYPAPFLPELGSENNFAADIIDGSQNFAKIMKDYIKPDEGWLKPSVFGVENKYFMHTLVKDIDGFVQRSYFKVGEAFGLTAILESAPISQESTFKMSFYIGPKELSSIEKVDERLEQAMDYSGWWSPISRILLKALNWLFGFLHNYGLAIVALTILIRLILIPFSLRAERGLKERAEMQKRLQYIQQKFKNDPQARAQAQAEFVKKHGLGLGGCLPMLLQVPIFFGLSRVLASSIELYKAPFLWIPDLSARDPYYILPVIVMFGIVFAALTSTDSKQRIPMIAMGLAFGGISANLSAGLVLYIAFSSILNIVQTWIFKLFRLVR